MVTPYTHGMFGLGLGHVFTAGRMPVLFWFLAGFLPVCPDFDRFWMATYGGIWGHRGFTHSLLFALVVALMTAAVTIRYFKVRFVPLWIFFFLVRAAHGLLDAVTNGGEGIPLFWPLSAGDSVCGDRSRFKSSASSFRTRGGANPSERSFSGYGYRDTAARCESKRRPTSSSTPIDGLLMAGRAFTRGCLVAG
jgi:hypothetical protein